MTIVVTGSSMLTPLADCPEKAFSLVFEGQTQIRENAALKESALPFSASSHFEEEYIEDVKSKWSHLLPDGSLNCYSALLMEVVGNTLQKTKIDLANNRIGIFVTANRLSEGVDEAINAYHCMNDEKTAVDLDKLADTRSDRPKYDFLAKRSEIAGQVLAGQLPNCHLIMMNCDACAGGNIAMINAHRALEQGQVDVAIVAGVECMANYISMLYFGLLGALAKSDSAPNGLSRPFDELRSGFVMGEAAACFVLQRESDAVEQGLAPLARFKGGAKIAEAIKMTATATDGSEYARCIEACLDNTGINASEVDHINAHGTSTPINDHCEALAIQKVFGEFGNNIPVTANKSVFGHSLGASGLIEAAISIQALRKGKVPPIHNLTKPSDHAAGLSLVRQGEDLECHSFDCIVELIRVWG